MTVCPVCEHPQPQGPECEVCGKRLVKGPTGADLVSPVDGLEPTSHPPADTGAERLAELEPTRHAAAAPADDRTPELEATRAAPVDVDAEPAPDVEPTAAGIPGDLPTVLPAVLSCRYCRTPAVSGERLCTRCGMRLPLPGGVREEAAAAAGRRCSCGTLVRGSLCPTCGARVA